MLGEIALYFSEHPRAWHVCVLLTCTLCSFVTARLLSRTQKKNILYVILPVTVFFLLSTVHSLSYVSSVFFNSAMAGTVTGILMSITPTVFQAKQLVVTVKRDELSSEVSFKDYDDVTARVLHTQIAESLSIPPHLLKVESGKGRHVDDLDSVRLEDVIHIVNSTPEVEKAICYVTVLDHTDGVISLGQHGRRASRTSIVSLLTNKLPLPPKLNMRAEVRLGVPVYMIGKMPNAADAGSSFSISCVQTYASATTNSSAKHTALRFLSWHKPGIEASHEVDDATSVGGMSNGSLDSGPVRCGSTVVIECDGKYLTAVRGKWLCWNSVTPRRSGAFSVEIWEKTKEKDHRLSKLTHMLSATKLQADTVTPGASSSTIARIVEKGEPLKSGDYFRLRSVKFPEMEVGVTNVRLENDYFYLGFAKVDDVGGNGWSMPLRLAVKIM